MDKIFGDDFDKTILTIGAVLITVLLIYKVIPLEILSAEMVMGLMQIPNTMISIAVGKKLSQNDNNGGNKQ